MGEDAALLAAMEATPTDDTPRLVYADWLDDHGRPGAEFIRIECELAQLEREREQEEELRARLRDEPQDFELVPDDDFEMYFSPRTMLVAQLLGASRGLDPAWVARVCRLPEDQLYARLREIQAWLRKRVSVVDALASVAKWDESPSPPNTLWGRVRRLFQRPPIGSPPPDGPHVRVLREWTEANLCPGDELWEYDTGGESWAHLCGEMGYAAVHDGKVVEFIMLMMN